MQSPWGGKDLRECEELKDEQMDRQCFVMKLTRQMGLDWPGPCLPCKGFVF